MAHADYDCCAVCDRKMSYGGDRTKEDLCSECAVGLARKGLFFEDVSKLLEWMNSEAFDPAALVAAGYSPCYYENEVDKRMKAALKGAE